MSHVCRLTGRIRKMKLAVFQCGVGLGANVLVGGLDKSIALQPLSVEGNKGLNVAAGIGAISLKSAP